MYKILFFLLICHLAWTQVTPDYPEKCETDKYPPDESTVAPTFEINLDLQPDLRWSEVTNFYKDKINGMMIYVKSFLLQISPKLKELIKIVDNAGLIAEILPFPYGLEMKGIARDTGMPLGDVVFYNVFYEIFTLCTSIVAQDSQGNMLHARNLDFGLFIGWDVHNDTWIISELLRPMTFNAHFMRDGKLLYKSVNFAGFVGLITAVKPGAFGVTMNERFSKNGGWSGLFEYIVGINRRQHFVTLLLRDVFENEELTYTEVVKTLSSAALVAPCYYIISGAKPGQASVVTRERSAAVDVWTLSKDDPWFLVETNYDHWKKPLFIDDRVTPAKKCLNKVGQNNITISTMFNVLSSQPMLNKLTVYTAVMSTASGAVETYIQDCKTPCWPF